MAIKLYIDNIISIIFKFLILILISMIVIGWSFFIYFVLSDTLFELLKSIVNSLVAFCQEPLRYFVIGTHSL